ncbi:hypothetical protein [Streptomyces acidiscabies]|uniref:Uncharacterized protein n=1 Tax=Streptomyces acidiscabies TaxID=42234 RepID=A0AAP6BJ24_9ACTN|nr:hypothetical protein [Streptomyces acidiscabies]MBP5935429.1 hypothetical protein [Streptomyces sp. LBUM 1476]MBZ3916715.1 hypothetical protein [Streptomyces acidiscabies]MDX2965649.1 hypothetical protein [Streptomyces acidiscabies]MDX3024849.1 hypothetical protein [Streptomyces acidiscabies]MDX3795565.1 hypothetical protein [Streptomyces acidiscabies]
MQPKKAGKPVPSRPDEVLAEAIVNAVLGTYTVDRDDNTENGKPDFVLAPRRGGAATVALEVSSCRDSKLQELWSSLEEQYRDEVLPGLRKGWFVEFTSGSRVKGKGAHRLAGLLADLEARGVDRVSVREWENPRDGSAGTPDVQQLKDIETVKSLRIKAVAQVGDTLDVAGRIFCGSLASGVGLSTAADVPPYVEEFLAGPAGANKIKKLGRARAKGLEPHLFLWADAVDLSIGTALDHRFIPCEDPVVPPEIQVVWLSSFSCTGAVYQWDRDGGWRVHDVTGVTASDAGAV